MSDVGSFRARFDAMVAELRAHAAIEVHAVEVRPGASPEQLRAAEAELGRPLPPAMAAFYAAHDGVFLEWGLRGEDAREKTSPFGYPDYGQPPGCINLLPLAQAMTGDWEADSHVNEIQDDHWCQIYGAVPDPLPPFGSVCVDNFSKYNHGDLLLGPEPLMIVSSDHGADMESSDAVDFSTYLDLTLALYGLNRYRYGIGIGWSREPRRLAAWTERPGLDALLAKLREKG